MTFVCGGSEISRKSLILHIYSRMFMLAALEDFSPLLSVCLCVCVVGPDEM